MSSSESRAQMMNPLLVKAGIPAALSVAAYICAKIVSKRSNDASINPEQDCPTSENVNSTSFDHYQREDRNASLQLTENVHRSGNLGDTLLVEHLQRRERDLKMQFLRYQAMKEREFMLMEIRNKLILEKTRAKFLVEEMSIVQDESKRMGGLILEYIKVVQKLQDSNLENKLLERKARMLGKRGRQRLRVIRKLKLSIVTREDKLLSNHQELQRKDQVIQELENEISQMKEVIDHLQREKFEISSKLDDAPEKPYSSNHKEGIEGVTKEEHERVLKEVEQLKKDREREANEVTYLKWSNACLRHELMRCHEKNKNEFEVKEEEEEEEEEHHVETEDCECNKDNQNPSRRRRFIQKVKKWVEGGKMDNQVMCLIGNKHSLSPHQAEDFFVPPRNSCSSV